MEQGCIIRVYCEFIYCNAREALGKKIKLRKQQKPECITTVTNGITRRNNRHRLEGNQILSERVLTKQFTVG